jgi:ketosteroid isomerase-like protein
MAELSKVAAQLLERTARANSAWVAGENQYADLMSNTPDLSAFGPFGGEALQGAIGPMRATQNKLAARFMDGRSKLELINCHESDGLVVLIFVERGEASFDGYDKPQRWTLRVTQVYQREADKWTVVHRHADPLIERRTFDEAIALVSKKETYPPEIPTHDPPY